MIKEAIVKIVNKGDLSYDEAYAVMNEIMSGEKRRDHPHPERSVPRGPLDQERPRRDDR